MNEAMAIVGAGVSCPVGLSTLEAASSLRAGVSRKSETGFIDAKGEAIVVGHLAEPLLSPLAPPLLKAGLTRLERRITRLAGGPLREALAPLPEAGPLPLLLAAPQAAPETPPLLAPRILELCAWQSDCALELRGSALFPLGRAGLFWALSQAGELLHSGRAPLVVVGGADSFLDAERLRDLTREGRLRSSGPGDTLTPGEGAAFVLLTTRANCRAHRLTPLAWIAGVGLGMEPGHRYSTAPYLGEGLVGAVTDLYTKLPTAPEAVRLALTGLTGESMGVKEWGIVLLRHGKRFAPKLCIEHAAEFIGDAGSALAPIMLACGAHHLHRGTTAGPALLWGASDRGQRGALLLSSES